MIIPAAVALLAFNLVCTGEAWTSVKLMSPAENKRPFETIYRVDLASGRYCLDACTTTFKLKEVTENRILFELEERGPLDDTLTFVNRENGRYMHRTRAYISGDTVLITVEQGECIRAPFTGLPTRKF